MKKNKRKLNYLLVVILLLLVSVGYAILSTNLNIIGTGTINNPTWNIHWENVQVKTGSVSATTPTIDTAKTTVNYSVTLTIPGDYYEFTVDAVNAGTIDGMVSVVSNKLNNTEITTLPNYLEYKVTYEDGVNIAPNHLLAANSSEKYKVHVGYKKDISSTDIPATPQTLNLSFSVTYVQSNENIDSEFHLITKYTVNVTNYYNDEDFVWIGKNPTSNITLYNTVEEAKASFSNRPFYLKHELEHGVVKDSYACYELNNNTTCLKGQKTYENIDGNWKCKSEYLNIVTNRCESTYYESNKTLLKESFGETNCTQNTSNYDCVIPGLHAYVYEEGSIHVDNSSGDCNVDNLGSSYCCE